MAERRFRNEYASKMVISGFEPDYSVEVTGTPVVVALPRPLEELLEEVKAGILNMGSTNGEQERYGWRDTLIEARRIIGCQDELLGIILGVDQTTYQKLISGELYPTHDQQIAIGVIERVADLLYDNED